MRNWRIVAKLVASTRENSRSSLLRSQRSASTSTASETRKTSTRGEAATASRKLTAGHCVPRSGSQECPGLAAHFVGGDEPILVVSCQERLGLLALGIAAVGEPEPEGGVDEDQLQIVAKPGGGVRVLACAEAVEGAGFYESAEHHVDVARGLLRSGSQIGGS